MIYDVLYPYCRGEVLELLIRSAQARESYDVFHEKLLEQLIPARQLNKLRVDRYERIQAPTETLAQYYLAIKEAAQVLRIKESESQVVARIVEGLNPNQRARFVFLPLPTSFQDLDKWIVVDRNLTFPLVTKEVTRFAKRESTGQVQAVEAVDKYRRGGTGKAPTAAKRPICYKCGKVGHIKRNCYVRRTVTTHAVQEKPSS
jgi:hypothetical protein